MFLFFGLEVVSAREKELKKQKSPKGKRAQKAKAQKAKAQKAKAQKAKPQKAKEKHSAKTCQEYVDILGTELSPL